MGSEKSLPTTRPSGPICRLSSRARSPVPQQMSSASEPGPTCARSTARWRHSWWSPAVIAEFIRSYTPAIRSNIPRTSVANSSESRLGTPLPASVSDETLMRPRLMPDSVERGEGSGQRLLLLRREARVGGHDARANLQRAGDRGARDLRADLGQLGAGAIVSVVAQLVA